MSDFLDGKLDNQEIKNKIVQHVYPSGFKPSVKLVDNIIDQFWFHDFYNNFVSEESYLQYLLDFLDKTKPQKFNRFDFYIYIFGQIYLQPTGKKQLQKIALEFEKHQSDAMSPGNYERLLQKLGITSGLFNASWMETHHLGSIKKRDELTLFIWDHHTLTEFLVAEYLLANKNTIEKFMALAVFNQEGITALKPSWTGVLRFLMESPKQQEMVIWLIAFLEKYPDNLTDYVAELLTFVSPNSSPKINKNIFNLIYHSYFNRVVWLPIWARSRIARFVDKDSYKRLKEDITEWLNATETFVRRGNAVSVVEGLLKENSKLLIKDEKAFWKKILIDFANNPQDSSNGVLQRHSLSALIQYHDDTIIPLVAQKCFDESTDSLVRDTFIQFCFLSAPNSKVTIDYLIQGIKSGSNVYARHGLYEITDPKALEYLLSKISVDETFIFSFLENESIFDKDGADKAFVQHIADASNPQIITALKKIISTVIRMHTLYKKDQSTFIREITKIIGEHDPHYVFEILKDIKDEGNEDRINLLVYDSKELIAPLLTPTILRDYFETFSNFPERSKRDALYPIYIAKRVNGKVGNQVYQEAVKLGYIQEIDQEQEQKNFEKQQKKRKEDVYKDFIKLLEPEPGKYNPEVFKYFTRNEKDIKERWSDKDIKRLKKLVIDWGIEKVDPREFQLTIQNKHEGNNQFSWSSQAAYFGDMLDVIKVIVPEEIKKHRQKIIDFIPFNFDTGSTLDFVSELQDKELEWINSVMSDKSNDRRYLIPQTYIYVVSEYAKRGSTLPSVNPILKSFIDDPEIQEYNQASALENLTYFTKASDNGTKQFLQNIFDTSKSNRLVKSANSVLISVFQDEEAINWRFSKLKEPIEFDRREHEGVVHEVGPAEEELDSLTLAKPLIDLKDEKYLPKFFDLLQYSFEVTQENRNKKYWDYANYLWQIVISFVDRLKEKGSFKPLFELEKWILKIKGQENANWLNARVNELRNSYIQDIGKYDK